MLGLALSGSGFCCWRRTRVCPCIPVCTGPKQLLVSRYKCTLKILNSQIGIHTVGLRSPISVFASFCQFTSNAIDIFRERRARNSRAQRYKSKNSGPDDFAKSPPHKKRNPSCVCVCVFWAVCDKMLNYTRRATDKSKNLICYNLFNENVQLFHLFSRCIWPTGINQFSLCNFYRSSMLYGVQQQ